MMLPFLGEDGCDGAHRGFILPPKLLELVFEMAEHNPFHGHGRGGDRAPTKETGDQAKRETARAAQPEAPTTALLAALEFAPENAAVSLFMRLELPQFIHHAWRGESSEEELSRIDVHSAVLARVIDLQHAGCVVAGIAGRGFSVHGRSSKNEKFVVTFWGPLCTA